MHPGQRHGDALHCQAGIMHGEHCWHGIRASTSRGSRGVAPASDPPPTPTHSDRPAPAHPHGAHPLL